MNSINQSNSSFEGQHERRSGIQWLVIAAAIVIYFVTEYVVYHMPLHPGYDRGRPHETSGFIIVDLITMVMVYFAPWLAGSIVLAVFVKRQMELQVVAYAATLALVSLAIGMLSSGYFRGSVLTGAFWVFMFAFVITAPVVTVFRPIRNFFYSDRSSPS